MRGKFKTFIEALNRERNGITGLETAIILIAFVVVASVFAYTVLSAGIFSSQKAQEALHSGMANAGCTLELKGCIVAVGNATANGGNGDVDEVIFTVGNSMDGGAIDLRSPTDNDGDHRPDAGSAHITTISFHSDSEVNYDLVYTATQKGWGDGDNVMETGEKFEIIVDLRSLSQALQPYNTITLEIKPPTGAVVIIERTLPSSIQNYFVLH